jgi:hypothetical protein
MNVVTAICRYHFHLPVSLQEETPFLYDSSSNLRSSLSNACLETWIIMSTLRLPLCICTNKLPYQSKEFEVADVLVTASTVWWSEFLAADPGISVSIPGATIIYK